MESERIESKFFQSISSIPYYHYIRDIYNISLQTSKGLFFRLKFTIKYDDGRETNVVIDFKDILGYNIELDRKELKHEEIQKIYYFIETLIVSNFINLANYYDLVSFFYILFLPNRFGKTLCDRYNYFIGYSFYERIRGR